MESNTQITKMIQDEINTMIASGMFDKIMKEEIERHLSKITTS